VAAPAPWWQQGRPRNQLITGGTEKYSCENPEKWDGGTKEGFGAACRDFFFFWIPDTSIKDMARLLMC